MPPPPPTTRRYAETLSAARGQEHTADWQKYAPPSPSPRASVLTEPIQPSPSPATNSSIGAYHAPSAPVGLPRPRARGLLSALVVASTLATGAAAAYGWWSWSHPRIVIRNELVTGVELNIEGSWIGVNAANSEVFRLSNRKVSSVEWRIARSTDSVAGDAHGQWTSGMVAISIPAYPWRTGSADLNARDGSVARFAPLITNSASVPLYIRVDAELAAPDGAPLSQDCTCSIPPGATRRFIGYFSLYANSNVRAVTAGGDSATFENIGASVDSRSGRLALRFTDADFRHQ